MNTSKKLEHVEEEISKQIKSIKSKADGNKRKASVMHLSSAALGAIITISLGVTINEMVELALKNIALILGALVTFISAADIFFSHKSFWIKQKSTLLDLYLLKDKIDFYKAGIESEDEIKIEEVQQFFNDYLEIWENSRDEYKRLRQTQIQSN